LDSLDLSDINSILPGNQECDSMKLIKGTLWIFIGLVFSKLASLIIRMLVARTGVTDTGIFYLADYVLDFGILLSYLGFQAYIVRDIAEAMRKKNKAKVRSIIIHAYNLLVPVSIVIAGILYWAAPYIAQWMNEQHLLLPLRIVSLGIPFGVIFGLARSYFRGTLNVRAFLFFAHFGKDIIRVAVVVVFFLLMGTMISILFGVIISLIVIAILAMVYLHTQLPKTSTKASINLRKTFAFTTPLFGAAIATTALEWVDSFMIGKMLSTTQVGLYDTAFSIAWLLMLLPIAIHTLFLPKLIHIHNKYKQLRNYYERVLAVSFAGNGLIAACLYLFGELIIRILFGADFAPGYIVLQILAVGFWIGMSLYPARGFLFIRKRASWLFLLAACAIVFNIIANYFAIKLFGPLGAAIATSCSIFLVYGGYVILTYVDLGISPMSWKINITCYAMLLVIAGSMVIKTWSLIPYIIGSIVLLFCYLGVHFLSPDWRKEISFMIKVTTDQ